MSPTEKKPNKIFRKKLLIYPKFQLTLLALNVVSIVMTNLVFYLFVNQSYKDLRLEGIDNNLPIDHAYFQFLDYQWKIIFKYLGLAMGINILLFGVFTIILSNKLAGPIIRLHSYFKNIILGQRPVPSVFFRKGDFFRDLPPLINEAVDAIQKDKGALPVNAPERIHHEVKEDNKIKKAA